MAFDVSKNWVILATPACRVQAARDLAKMISKLRESAGFARTAPVIIDSENAAPEGAAEIILNCDEGSQKNSFAWRTAEERIEIYGHSLRSLDNAIFDFLQAITKHCGKGVFSLAKKSAHNHHDDKRQQIFIQQDMKYKDAKNAVIAAGRSVGRAKINEIVLSLSPKFSANEESELLRAAADYHLEVSRGGDELSRELSLLVPRKLFLFHRSLFRMEDGRRKKDGIFCASNDKTLEVIKKNAVIYFEKYKNKTKRYYFFTAASSAQWCACPACRAFTFEEQKLMALSAAAAVLAKIDPAAKICYRSYPTTNCAVKPLPNMEAVAV